MASTEIYEGGRWTYVRDNLPAAVQGVRGASVQNTVYMMGKRIVMICVTDNVLLGGVYTTTEEGWISSSTTNTYVDGIWKYDADTKQWEWVGNMSVRRSFHAVTTMASKDLVKYCN